MRFPYSYRGGLQADAGFLLAGDGGKVFMAVGNRHGHAVLGLAASLGAHRRRGDDDETDLMDFDMM